MSVRGTIESYFHHFNAGELSKMSASLLKHIDSGGKVFITLAGAMSTAGIGHLLSQMLREGHVAAISCTGANLEEDVFRMMASPHYESIENWRTLSLEDEQDLHNKNMNRVTDVCIPENQAIRVLESHLLEAWKEASENTKRQLPHHFFFDVLRSESLLNACEGDTSSSWVLAACEENVPIYVPGWEDSTMGNIFAARSMEGDINSDCVLSGIEYMKHLATWYEEQTSPLAFLQIGGGIAGDFPICVVPMSIKISNEMYRCGHGLDKYPNRVHRSEDILVLRQAKKSHGVKSMQQHRCLSLKAMRPSLPPSCLLTS